MLKLTLYNYTNLFKIKMNLFKILLNKFLGLDSVLKIYSRHDLFFIKHDFFTVL